MVDQKHKELFDAYAQAALSGMLANRTVLTSVTIHNHIVHNEKGIPRTIVEAAMEYAALAVKRRNELFDKETEKTKS